MLERLRLHLREMRGAFFLIKQGMTRIAVLADHAAVFADMVAIVAAETSREIHVSDVVGMRLPVDLHRGEERRSEYSLDFGDGVLNAVSFGRSNLRVFISVELR